MLGINYSIENDEVFYCKEKFPYASNDLVQTLKLLAIKNKRERIRVCMHEDKNSKLHEMLILHTNKCYIRPHAHLFNDESITIFEGVADLIIFDKNGNIETVVRLSDYASPGSFYFKIRKNVHHMLLIRSEFLVFKEVTEGPFSRLNLLYPDWSPSEESNDHIAFIARINNQLKIKNYAN
jgi:cupin fold WbuC family metalloprotein